MAKHAFEIEADAIEKCSQRLVLYLECLLASFRNVIAGVLGPPHLHFKVLKTAESEVLFLDY